MIIVLNCEVAIVEHSNLCYLPEEKKQYYQSWINSLCYSAFPSQQVIPGNAFEEHPTVPDCMCISPLSAHSRPFVLVLCAVQEGLDSWHLPNPTGLPEAISCWLISASPQKTVYQKKKLTFRKNSKRRINKQNWNV